MCNPGATQRAPGHDLASQFEWVHSWQAQVSVNILHLLFSLYDSFRLVSTLGGLHCNITDIHILFPPICIFPDPYRLLLVHLPAAWKQRIHTLYYMLYIQLRSPNLQQSTQAWYQQTLACIKRQACCLPLVRGWAHSCCHMVTKFCQVARIHRTSMVGPQIHPHFSKHVLNLCLYLYFVYTTATLSQLSFISHRWPASQAWAQTEKLHTKFHSACHNLFTVSCTNCTSCYLSLPFLLPGPPKYVVIPRPWLHRMSNFMSQSPDQNEQNLQANKVTFSKN